MDRQTCGSRALFLFSTPNNGTRKDRNNWHTSWLAAGETAALKKSQNNWQETKLRRDLLNKTQCWKRSTVVLSCTISSLRNNDIHIKDPFDRCQATDAMFSTDTLHHDNCQWFYAEKVLADEKILNGWHSQRVNSLDGKSSHINS